MGTSTLPRPARIARMGRLTSDDVWRAIGGASFAVLSHVTPRGEPRSTGIVYATVGRRLYVAVAPDSWKAAQIAENGHISVTVLVRRGGLLSLVFPIPPATISFSATATVYASGSFESPALAPARKALEALLPPERRAAAAIVEIEPVGAFLTYGIGVSLMQMRNPQVASARVAVA